MADHARHPQAALRHDAVRVVVTAVKSGSERIAVRATSLNAMFCADSFGAEAIATQ